MDEKLIKLLKDIKFSLVACRDFTCQQNQLGDNCSCRSCLIKRINNIISKETE
jgi:hypothetical protein